MTQRTCPTCGAEVVRQHPTGPVATYCSAKCRAIANKPAAATQAHARVIARRRAGAFTCQWEDCGKPLTKRANKWCPEHLREQRHRENVDSLTKTCTVDGCERPLRAKGECNMHYRRTLRAAGKLKDPWSPRRKRNWHIRRARLAGAENSESFTLADIIERDGNECQGCHLPVDLTLVWPDQMSKSIDHRLPISRGGEHVLANAQLMHVRCNSSKGNRVTTEAA